MPEIAHSNERIKGPNNIEWLWYRSFIYCRGSSELVLLASQLTKPLKVKRLFPSLVCFLNPSPEAPSSIDLKRENMNSILIITNLTCWLLVSWLRLEETDCRPTDWLCYEFFWREILLLDSTPQGLISPLWWTYHETFQSLNKTYFLDIGLLSWCQFTVDLTSSY